MVFIIELNFIFLKIENSNKFIFIANFSSGDNILIALQLQPTH